jgi:hypothetical protein
VDDGVQYIDGDGTLKTHDNVTIIDSGYFVAAPYVLDSTGADGGWYLVRGTFALAGTLTITGGVHLILENGCDMRVEGTFLNAGINVSGANSLTIYGQSVGGAAGTLTTKTDMDGAGIGGGSNGSGGTITINGGTIDATGGTFGAGIGGGYGGNGGTITINGGSVNAVAGASGAGGAGIGGGWSGSGGAITINGGNVTAVGTRDGAGIGGGYRADGGAITINGGNIESHSYNQLGAGQLGGAAGIGGGNSGSGGTITINGGNVEARSGDNNVGAGIGGGYLASGGTITINGGNVTADGGAHGAGIGSGYGNPVGAFSGGNITITNGIVTATGGLYGAGIGGGNRGSGGTIAITGGSITATGGVYGAGIGGGSDGSAGDILIIGGTTKVAVKAGTGAQDIGFGDGGGSDGSVFVMLKYGNLTEPDGTMIGNKVLFTADPLTVTGTVSASLPAPFGRAGPSGNGKISMMTGLGPDGPTGPSAKAASVITSLMTQTTEFELDGYNDSPQRRTGAQLMGADASVDFHGRSYFEVTVDVTGDGSVEIAGASAVYGTVIGSAAGVFRISENDREISLTATAGMGYGLERFIVNGVAASGNPLTVKMDSDKSVTAVFSTAQPEPPEPKTYVITATADQGSAITPSGKISASRGDIRTFAFSASDGYVISSVAVDGKDLDQQQIDLGRYTFFDIMRNHTINVKSIEAGILLTIDVVEGEGRAVYSVNGGLFQTYDSPATLPEHADVVLRAYADGGYVFKVWKSGAETFRYPQVSFKDVGESVHLDLYFVTDDGSRVADPIDDDDSGFPWRMLATALLISAGILLWLIFRGRRYEVVKVGGTVSITGKDKARRKAAYRFTAEGAAGAASYRVGEDGAWKTLLPGADGEYVIPKGEITDSVTIEFR